MEPRPQFERFTVDPIPEIHLDRAPIVKVLTQVQFSDTPDLISEDNERKLANALPQYPVRRHNQSFQVSVNPVVGTADTKPIATRIFADQEQSWVVTVTERTVSLETGTYHSRDDFCGRLLTVLEAVSNIAIPPTVDRVGLRYVNRLSKPEDLDQLNDFVNPRLEVLCGAVERPLVVEYSVSDSIIQITASEKLRVRSGLLPPNMLLDPILTPVPEASWILDLDMFTSQGGLKFEPEALESRVRRFSENIYSFFSWATTDKFENSFTHADTEEG